MREVASSAVVECSTMKDWPCSENSAPRAKSGWPPEEDQYSLPSDSEAHWPRKSTSRVALIATKLSSLVMLRSSLVWSTGQNSTPGFSFTNSYSLRLPRESAASQGVSRDGLVAVGALAGAGDDTSLYKIYKPISEQLGVDPKLLVVAQQPEYLIRNRADPGLQRSAVRYPLCDVPGDLAVGLSYGTRWYFAKRVVGLAPPDDLADMHLILAVGAGHPVVHLDEEGSFSDQCRHIISVGAQREVAVAIRRPDRSEHQRASRGAPHQGWHFAEVVGCQIAGVLVEGLAVGRREKPGDMPEAREITVHITSFAIREQLVDPDNRQPLR